MRNKYTPMDPFNGELGWVLGIVIVTVILFGLMMVPR